MDFKRILNEAFNEFDFLNNNKLIKEEQFNSILSSGQFIKAFINDVVNNFNSKIKFDNANILDASINDEDIVNGDEPLNIDFAAKIKYLAKDNKYVPLGISIEGENVDYNLGSNYDKGDYYTKSSSEIWFDNINWQDVIVKLYNSDFDIINDNILKDIDKETAKRFILKFIAPYFSIKIQ